MLTRQEAEIIDFHWNGSVLFKQHDPLGAQFPKVSGLASSTSIPSSALCLLLKLELEAVEGLTALTPLFSVE